MRDQEKKEEENMSKENVQRKRWYKSFIRFFITIKEDLKLLKNPLIYVPILSLIGILIFSFNEIVFTQTGINIITYALLSVLLIAALQAIYLFKRKNLFNFFTWFQVITFITIIILSLLLWYAVIWSHAGNKRIEAFNGFTSTLAFWGLIATIIVQVYHQYKAQDISIKTARANHLTDELNHLLELEEENELTFEQLKEEIKSSPQKNIQKLEKRRRKILVRRLSIKSTQRCMRDELNDILPSMLSKRTIDHAQQRREKEKKISSLINNEDITPYEFDEEYIKIRDSFFTYKEDETS